MIETTFTISQDDFIEAQKIWAARMVRKVPGRFLVNALGAAFGASVGASLHYLPLVLAAAVVASLLAVLAFTRWRKRTFRRYQYARRNRIAETSQIRIDETGYYEDRPETCKSSMAWGRFADWIETPQAFIMGSELTYVAIPKPTLSSDQQTELRSLLNNKLGASL